MRKSALFGLLFAAAVDAGEAAAPRNLGFESPLEEGWTTKFEGKAEFDGSTRHEGARSLRLSGPATRIAVERALAQSFDATEFRGRRVQVAGRVRYAGSRIGLWLSAGRVTDLDREGKRDPGESGGWKRLVARIDVPYDAETVTIGARIYFEEGEPVWIDDLVFETCPEGTPLFDARLPRARFENLDFERAGEEELPDGWTFESGEVGDPMDDDFESSVYRFVRDPGSRVSGAACARIERVSGPAAGSVARQYVDAGFWRGKKLRLTLHLRWDDQTEVPSRDGPFLQIRNGAGDIQETALEWGESPLSAWRLAEFVVQVPEDAETIILEIRLERGTLWLDAGEARAAE